jgi:hypothetical protein
MPKLTDSEWDELREHLEEEEEEEQETIVESKNSFLDWLKGTHLGYLVDKFIGWAFAKILNFLGF